MMWRKREETDDGKALAARLASVLGVRLDESAAPDGQPATPEAADSVIGEQADVASTAPHPAPPRPPLIASDTLPKLSEAVVPPPSPRREPAASRPPNHRQPDELGPMRWPASTRFSREHWLAGEARPSGFDVSASTLGLNAMPRSAALPEVAESRGQFSRAQTEEMISAVNSTLTRFTRDTREAAHAQTQAFEQRLAGLFEQNLAKFSEQIACRTQAGVEAVSSRVETTRAQSEEINSKLLATLARFNEETQEAAQARAKAFEEKLTGLLDQNLSKFSQHLAAQTEAGLETAARGAQAVCGRAEEASSALQTTLAQFTEHTQEAARAQAKAFEDKLTGLLDQNFSKFSGQIAAQTQAGIEADSSRAKRARTEAEEISATLQTTLAEFNERSQSAALAQSRALEEKLAGLFDQNLSIFSKQIAS
ncbi:MAG TPA: hypothetical protein VL523_03690, partial [Terriglobia bacterium]|nr:hypothetical protein [Terriglobia bacterium]